MPVKGETEAEYGARTGRAVTGPRSLRDPREREYAIQTMRSMKRYLDSKVFDAQGVAKELQLIQQYRHWEVCGFKTLDAYLRAEIGLACKQLERRLAQDLAPDPDVPPLRDEEGGRPPKDENYSNGMVSRPGNSADYIVRRLKRDHPAIAEALARGEFPSARAAGLAAGIVKSKTPLDALRAAWRKASKEERETFRQEIDA